MNNITKIIGDGVAWMVVEFRSSRKVGAAVIGLSKT